MWFSCFHICLATDRTLHGSKHWIRPSNYQVAQSAEMSGQKWSIKKKHTLKQFKILVKLVDFNTL